MNGGMRRYRKLRNDDSTEEPPDRRAMRCDDRLESRDQSTTEDQYKFVRHKIAYLRDIAFVRYVKQDYDGAIAKLRDIERHQSPLELDCLVLLAECQLHSTKMKAVMATIEAILRCLKSFSTTQLFFWGRLLDTPSHRVGWMIVHAAMAQNVEKFASSDEYSDMVMSMINSVGWKGYHMLKFGSRSCHNQPLKFLRRLFVSLKFVTSKIKHAKKATAVKIICDCSHGICELASDKSPETEAFFKSLMKRMTRLDLRKVKQRSYALTLALYVEYLIDCGNTIEALDWSRNGQYACRRALDFPDEVERMETLQRLVVYERTAVAKLKIVVPDESEKKRDKNEWKKRTAQASNT